MDIENLKKRYFLALYEEKAFLIKEDYIKLHHGGESHLYLNHNLFLSKYTNLQLLTNIYEQLIATTISDFKLGAVDSVMSPVLCGLLAANLRRDVVVTKERRLEHGLENKVYGNTEGNVILVDDVTSTGTILLNAASVLREKGASVGFAVVSACRDLTAVENLASKNIKTMYVATFEEIIQSLWDVLTDSEKAIVVQEVKEKQYNWSVG